MGSSGVTGKVEKFCLTDKQVQTNEDKYKKLVGQIMGNKKLRALAMRKFPTLMLDVISEYV